MDDGSEFRRNRRDVLRLLSGTGGLTIGGITGVSGQRIKSPAGTPSDSSPVSAGAGRQPRQSLRAGEWTQQAKLAADDGDSDDNFGISVTVSGNGTTAVVGAWIDEDPNGDRAGSAYVFERSGGAWTQQAKLAADDGDSDDGFGVSVAVSDDGTTAIIGAGSDEDPNGDRAGSAYVFEGSGGEWVQQAKLAAADGDNGDLFGAVAVSGDGTTAIIGAPTDEDPNGRSAGSAYVFERAGGEWVQEAKLAANDGDSGDGFGFSVAISRDGTTAIVGAEEDEDPNGYQAGSAHVFEGSGSEWTQQARLAADDGDGDDRFGASVTISGDGTIAIVGTSTDEDPNGDQAGSAYVFEGSGGAWTQQAKLAADDGDSGDIFGASVAVSEKGTTAIVGAGNDNDPNGDRAGSAYAFERTGGEWTQRTKLAADDGDSGDLFGASMAVSRDGMTAITGAWVDGDPNGDGAGSAYVFETDQRASETTTTTTDGGTTAGDEESSGQTSKRPSTEASAGQTSGGTTTEGSGGGDSGSTPGFGVGGLLAGLIGTGYLLWRDSEADSEE